MRTKKRKCWTHRIGRVQLERMVEFPQYEMSPRLYRIITRRRRKRRKGRRRSSSSRRRRPRQSENRITEMLKAEKQF